MLHSIKELPVIVERDDFGLKVVLHEWGDKDYLEDRLMADFGIKELSFLQEGGRETEVFTIYFPGREDQAALQEIIDEIE